MNIWGTLSARDFKKINTSQNLKKGAMKGWEELKISKNKFLISENDWNLSLLHTLSPQKAQLMQVLNGQLLA